MVSKDFISLTAFFRSKILFADFETETFSLELRVISQDLDT